MEGQEFSASPGAGTELLRGDGESPALDFLGGLADGASPAAEKASVTSPDRDNPAGGDGVF